MGIVLSIAALLLLLAAGVGCALLLLPRRDPAHPVAVAGLSVVLGSAFVAATSFVLGLVVTGLALQVAVAVACVGVALLGARCGARVALGLPLPVPVFWVLPVVAFGVELGLLMVLGGRYQLGWDSLVVWEFKARVATLNGGGMPVDYYLDTSRQWSHPEYPLLLPLTEAWLFDWTGQADERLVRVLFGVFDLAMLCSLYVLGRQLGGSRLNGILAAVLLPLVPQLIIGYGGATTGWADYLVGLLYLLAGGYLVQALLSKRQELFGLVSILSAALAWTKQEGAILWLWLVVITIVMAQGMRLRAVVIMTIPTLTVVVAWRLFLQQFGVSQLGDFLPINWPTLQTHVDRVPFLFGWTVQQMSDTRSWGLLWPGIACALLLPGWSKVRQQLLLGLMVIGPVVTYAMTFVFSAWTPYTTHVEAALPRLMEQVAPLGILAIACASPVAELGWFVRSRPAPTCSRGLS